MRIDFVITELNVGGAEQALTQIALGMRRRGHSVRVFSIGSAPHAQRARLVRSLAREHIEVQFGGFDSWTLLPVAVGWLARQFRADPPQVCQSFLFHANCLSAAACKVAGIRALVGGLRVAELRPWRCRLEQRALAKTCAVTCVSDRVRQFAIDQLRLEPSKCVTIPNGVDVDAFANAPPLRWSELGWPDDSQVALYVGRFHPQKGLESIQAEVERLLAKPWRKLVLVGDGPLRESLRQWAESMPGDQIRILPWRADVAPLMRAARMLLLPSHYEGMPNVVLEAMAAGLPVVFSLVEGSEELLGTNGSHDLPDGVDRRGCQGFAPGDSKAMADLVCAFFDHAVLSHQVGKANQTRVREQFSIAAMVNQYGDLYERCQISQLGC